MEKNTVILDLEDYNNFQELKKNKVVVKEYWHDISIKLGKGLTRTEVYFKDDYIKKLIAKHDVNITEKVKQLGKVKERLSEIEDIYKKEFIKNTSIWGFIKMKLTKK